MRSASQVEAGPPAAHLEHLPEHLDPAALARDLVQAETNRTRRRDPTMPTRGGLDSVALLEANAPPIPAAAAVDEAHVQEELDRALQVGRRRAVVTISPHAGAADARCPALFAS